MKELGGSVAGLQILAFCDYFSADSSGGAERVSHEVYARLAGAGASVTLLTTAPSGAARAWEVDGIRVQSVPSLDLSKVTRAQVSLSPRVVLEAARLGRTLRPDVLHANGLHFQTSVAAAVLRYRTGYPMVTTVHLARPEGLRPLLRTATLSYEQTVGRFVLHGSAAVIAVSEGVREHVLSLGVGSERIVAVPNGVDHARFHPAGGRPVVRPRPVVLFVGRLIPNKGPQVLLEAVRLLHGGVDLEAVFVGDGPLRAQLERTVLAAGLSDVVRFEGHSSDVQGWMRKADVLVRPSFTEGLPLGVLEAMASRLCVVASDVRGNRELVAEGRTGFLFPAGDARALVGTLARVLADADRRREVARAGWQASHAYTWDVCAAATGEVLGRAANRLPAAGRRT